MMFWVELAQRSRAWPISLYRGTKRYVQVTEYMYRDYTEIYNLTPSLNLNYGLKYSVS
jgi:hypothetical protein